ncbi:MAG: serine hydrolase domain-containing protein, partial [Saprospiraceae bacterium]|nr:serine hydrolase domain-containing protein [Saprospiraceae bacterium]
MLFLCATLGSIAQVHDQIEAYVKPLVLSNNFAGVVSVAWQGNRVFEQAFGMADHERGGKHTIDGVFQIASVSKPFTATAIMMLVEEGKLRLDDPVSRFVPDFTRGADLTVHHLLTHTSGIPNINSMPVYTILEQQDNAPAGLITHFKDLPLDFEPGERYGYSNSNYNLLAFIVEQVSGMEFGDFLSTRIFAPLDMTHTGHPGRHQDGQIQIVPGYAPEGITGIRPA